MSQAKEPQAPNRLHALLQRLRREGGEILELTESNPTHVGFTYPETEILAALSSPESLSYAPEPAGLLVARKSVAEYYAEIRSDPQAKHMGNAEQTTQTYPPVRPENLILTSGTSEAYGFLCKLLCKPGDEILIPSPCYPLLDCLSELEHVCLVKYPLAFHPEQARPWTLDLNALENSISTLTRVLVVVNPNNPTGHYFTADEARALLKIAARHDLAVVVDEVFRDYALLGKPEQYFAAESTQVSLTRPLFTLNGFSKTLGLPQLKLAWIHISGEEALIRPYHERLEFIADAYLSVNSPVQNAAAGLFRLRGQLQNQILSRLRTNLKTATDMVGEYSAVQILPPEGGWQLILLCDVAMDDETLSLILLEECRIFVHPGYYFDLPHPCGLVVSLLLPPERFREGLTRLLMRVQGLTEPPQNNSLLQPGNAS